jgi:hypothetical protein
MIQLVLPLHECAAKSVADPSTAKSAAEPLHSVPDPAASGAAPAKISC